MKPLYLLLMLLIGVGFGIWYLNEDRMSEAARNEVIDKIYDSPTPPDEDTE